MMVATPASSPNVTGHMGKKYIYIYVYPRGSWTRTNCYMLVPNAGDLRVLDPSPIRGNRPTDPSDPESDFSVAQAKARV